MDELHIYSAEDFHNIKFPPCGSKKFWECVAERANETLPKKVGIWARQSEMDGHAVKVIGDRCRQLLELVTWIDERHRTRGYPTGPEWIEIMDHVKTALAWRPTP